MSDQTPIPADLVDRVMSKCANTCCVCRDSSRPVQIHHIDKDPHNNSFENLAALCDDCHPDAHAGVPGFQGLSSRHLKMFNKSWRQLVRLRVVLSQSTHADEELVHELAIDTSNACQEWVNSLVWIRSGTQALDPGIAAADVWQSERFFAIPEFNLGSFEEFRPLFDDASRELLDELDRIQFRFGFLRRDLRVVISQTRRQLARTRMLFLRLERVRGETTSEIAKNEFPTVCCVSFGAVRRLHDYVEYLLLGHPQPSSDS